MYRRSVILLALQGIKRSDEWTIGRQYHEMTGDAEVDAVTKIIESETNAV